ncbi:MULTISPECIES: hypothetical protein [Pontibacter]|uniref:Outer membrane protein beta-barrel domain-containing protein n=1 Tax=Pontibacter lucknowensis TaxID=1077936 RepID=A0A1N7AW45_9BACT|nr:MULTISPECIES: hypothetical protein [Pontibacter]EJF10689.1 hypothetical protein O71_07444 [Pontibacter sp. BAB1700]SIR43274.1 hypothetical protein SAMN05421545_3624 [Pontibacter lucknowensis]
MKKVYLLLLALGSATVVFGQKMEYSAQLNSGLSRFTGESSTKTTVMVLNDTWGSAPMVINPYGNRYNVTYGGSLQAQFVAAGGFILGTQAGYEQLRTQAKIDRAHGFWSHSSSMTHPADGKAVIIADYINLQPYIGWRIKQSPIDLDLTLGSDIGFSQQMKERSEATLEDGTEFKTRIDRNESITDFRPRLGITGYHGHFGLSLSYAHGIKNYKANMEGANMKLYTQVIRAGLLYRL